MFLKVKAFEKWFEIGEMPKIVPLILRPICHIQKNKQNGLLIGSLKSMEDP